MAKKSSKAKKVAKKSAKQVKTPTKAKFWFTENRPWIILGILVLTFFVYSANLGHDFVNWDDDRNFYENPLITDINGENFGKNSIEIFKSRVIGNYNPLTIWTFAVEKVMFGLDDPGKWHLTNIILHMLCVLLVFKLSHQLGLGRYGSILVTLLFAIHPMRVESVAWVTERKDVLYGAFYLAALVYYIKNRKKPSIKYSAIIIILFTLSLFSKIQAVILPMSMLCIDYYLDKEFKLNMIFKKIHYFLMSILFGIMGILFLSENGSLDTREIHEGFVRIFIGSYSYVVYLIKLFVPYELSPMYPYPSTLGWLFYASMVALPITIGALWYAYQKKAKAVVFGLLFFIFNIFFLLQILGAGQGFLADRFTYIAYFGLFFILGWALETVIKRYPVRKTAALFSAGLFVGLMAFLNVSQNKIWENSDTMWTHVMECYPNSTLPYGNRANYLRDNGFTRRALEDYNMSILLNDKQPQAYNSRAKLFFNLAKTTDTLQMALRDYNKAIEYEPKNGEFYINRGATYARIGNITQAISDMDKGIELKPDHVTGYLNRSVMHNQQGNMPKALEDINSYLKLRPYNADMWYEKGRVMRQVGQVEQAIGAFDRAIQLDANKGIYYYERGRTQASLGRKAKGKIDLQKAINLGFKDIDAAFRADVGM